jgi:hypothetical protein
VVTIDVRRQFAKSNRHIYYRASRNVDRSTRGNGWRKLGAGCVMPNYARRTEKKESGD